MAEDIWNLFTRKGGAATPERLRTVMSTMAGKHGSVERDSEVPRRKLVDALKAETEFFSTQDLKAGQLKKVMTLAL
ncbi:MAG: hypothetical protein ABIR71_06635 [Chthoniobacterales bacterium]